MTASHVVRRGRPSPDLTGRRFSRLVALERAPFIDRRARWRCRCDCGTTAIVLAQCLLRGEQKSCGCLRREMARALGHNLKGTTRAPRSSVSGTRTKKETKSARISDAFAQVFRAPPDTVHVDRPGARVVRGTRY